MQTTLRMGLLFCIILTAYGCAAGDLDGLDEVTEVELGGASAELTEVGHTVAVAQHGVWNDGWRAPSGVRYGWQWNANAWIDIEVANLSYEKSVGIVYSVDDWATSKSAEASYEYTLENGREIWGVDLVAMTKSDCYWCEPTASTLKYAVFYRHGDATEWDNNGGRDFRLPLTAKYEESPAASWTGNFTAKITRAGGDACTGSYDMAELSEASNTVTFGTWARSRAAFSNVCFDVYKEGVSDWNNQGVDEALAATLVCDWGDGDVRRYDTARFHTFDGNNARFAFSISSIDPFFYYRCPDVPTSESGEGSQAYIHAEAVCHVEVDGRAFGPSGTDSTFTLAYTDYASSPFRNEHCQ